MVGCPNSHLGMLKAALLHDMKNMPKMLEMVAAVGAAHQVVVGEWEAERQVSEILVNEPLECLAGVAQPKQHKNNIFRSLLRTI